MGISMAETTHCKECEALVYKDETIRGLGFRCGCIFRFIKSLEERIKALENETALLR